MHEPTGRQPYWRDNSRQTLNVAAAGMLVIPGEYLEVVITKKS
jgi:hypothetical protein